AAIAHGAPVELDKINKFVDGAAVKKVGQLNYEMSSQLLDSVKPIPEGKICTTILELYNKDAIVAEPAGALSIAALEFHKHEIAGKKVVCVVSGGNNDIDRMSEIKEMSLLYEGFKHYFIVRFPQRPGALRLLVTEVLGPKDDITRFEYIKKTERERGPALIGIELNDPNDYISFIERLKAYEFDLIEVNKDQTLFEYLVWVRMFDSLIPFDVELEGLKKSLLACALLCVKNFSSIVHPTVVASIAALSP